MTELWSVGYIMANLLQKQYFRKEDNAAWEDGKGPAEEM